MQPSPPPAPTAETPPPPSKEAMDEVSALAARTSLPPGACIVCLGDSITEPAPYATKYPELLAMTFAARHTGTVKVINAGKGGDDVLKAFERVETDVIARRPTLVFINLGINDSKLVAPGHTHNFVPLERFKATYLDLIRKIQEATGAEVTVVGTLACLEEWTRAKAFDGPVRMNHFGVPEQLHRYNAAAREAGKTLGCDYIDLFDCFRAQPDLEALFPENDGVHAGPRGQELIALQLLRHLARKHPTH